jgi:nucleotide-binding universal stress UspA family protein
VAPSLRRVVVGVDGSAGSWEALDWAAAVASRAGAALTVVGAWSYGGHLHATPTPSEEAHRVVDEARTRLSATVPDVVARFLVREGTPAYVLIGASGDADLLVVGSRGLGGFRGLLLGSVGQHCLSLARCSLAVVRPVETPATSGAGATPRRIVVGVDGSPGAERALEWAVEEARRSDGELVAVAAWPFPGTAGHRFNVDRGLLDDARKAADQAVERVRSATERIDVRGDVSEDPPSLALVEASRKADLVVIGARGLHGFRGMWTGSVSRYVAEHAHCPVVVVRDPVAV